MGEIEKNLAKVTQQVRDRAECEATYGTQVSLCHTPEAGVKDLGLQTVP